MTQRWPRPLAPPLKESGMAPQRTAVITGSAFAMSLSDCSHAGHQRWEHRHWLDWQELRNPLPATSCVACRKIPRCCGVLFTWSAPSATINHNNLDTSNMPALILGIPSAGFKSGILLRARLGSDEDRRRGRRLSRPAARRSSGTRPHPLCSTERENSYGQGADPLAGSTGRSPCHTHHDRGR
jgi:hypothetical protein